MLRGVATVLEKHHRVQLLDEAIESAVKLSHRYIPARQLPDKAVSLLDTACAASRSASTRSRPRSRTAGGAIESLEIERHHRREAAVGVDVGTRRARSTRSSARARAPGRAREALAGREGIVDKVLALRAQLRGDDKPVDGPRGEGGDVEPPRGAEAAPIDARSCCRAARGAGAARDAAGRLAADHAVGRRQAVASVVADWTGIPVGRMVKNELQAILQLGERSASG
jgi:type VI secretion system protein VasG